MQPMRPGGAGRWELLTLVANFAVAAGSAPPHRRAWSSDAAGSNGSRRPMGFSYQADLGLLWLGCYGVVAVGLRQWWVVDDAKRRSTMALRAVPYGDRTVARLFLSLRLDVSASPVNKGPAAQREKDLASRG